MGDHADFSLTQLRYFVTSAEMGNISEAAQVLHASQSAVSMAIQRLERQLGTQLFVRRRTKGVSLTPTGHMLLADARSLLRQAQELCARSREWHGEVHGRLNVAFLHSITPFVFPALLNKFAELHPQLTITAFEGTVDEVRDLLRSGTCELAVTSEHSEREFTFTRLTTVPLLALVSPCDTLAKSGYATLKELATRPLLVVDGPQEHEQLPFIQAGLPTPEVIRTSSIGTMLGLVRAGVGFAMVRQAATCTALMDGCGALVNILSESPCVTEVGVTALQGLPVSRRAQEFTSALDEMLGEVYCTIEATREVA